MTCHRSGRAARAFTLVELLIVIGIIVLLIGILLPAASGIRRQAKVITTRSLIAAIESAVANYQADERDWPGPFNSDVQRANPGGDTAYNQIQGKPLTAVTPVRPTRSEELFLCMTGGMNVTWTGGGAGAYTVASFDYVEEDIGRGHMRLGPKNRGRLKDYMSGSRSRSGVNDTNALMNPGTASDSGVPEFVDAFSGPILYVRARKGETNISAYNALIDETSMYQSAFTYPTSIPPSYYPVSGSYLKSDSLPNQTRNQNRFILVSAGPDRKFGTADDVTNFGTPTINLP